MKQPPPLPVQPKHMPIALREAGIKERVGKADNPRILEYLSTVMQSWNPLMRDSTPWCSAFINHCLREAYPKRYNGWRARARAWMDFGMPVLIDEAEPGDIVLIKGRVIRSIPRHVTFYVRTLGDSVEGFGGNQRNSVCAALYKRSDVHSVRRVPRSFA